MLREKRLLMAVAWHYEYNQMLHYQLGDLEKQPLMPKRR